MNIYDLKTVREATIIGGNMSTNIYQIPVDQNGVIPDYLGKDRVIREDGKLLVFDTKEEYDDYINSLF
jgi:hypothetical protein